MQKDQSTSHGRFSDYSSLSSSIFNRSDGYGYNTSLYPSIFDANENLESPLPGLPYADDYSRLHQYSFTDHDEDLLEQQKLCLSKLLETSKEAEALRQENLNLQIANIELKKKFNDLLGLQSSSIPNCPVSPANHYSHTTSSNALCSSPLIDGFRGMRITEKPAALEDEASSKSIDTEDGENLDVNQVSLPKSISVPCDGYLKAVQTDVNKKKGSCPVRMSNRIKPVKPQQMMYVSGGKKEDTAVELQVYNQGVSKTELCNKWQQTGACPYGNSCRFAHGIEELRPVFGHSRYKTEVCRMVLDGEHCPYGHRCHFRHCLSEQEKLVAQQAKPRTI